MATIPTREAATRMLTTLVIDRKFLLRIVNRINTPISAMRSTSLSPPIIEKIPDFLSLLVFISLLSYHTKTKQLIFSCILCHHLAGNLHGSHDDDSV